MEYLCRSQWPLGLRRRCAAARLLRSLVRIPPETWAFVCCECCVLSRRGLCDELITLPEESYRLWCVVVCDLETSRMKRPWPALGRSSTGKENRVSILQFSSSCLLSKHVRLKRIQSATALGFVSRSKNHVIWECLRKGCRRKSL